MPLFLEPGRRYPIVLDCDADKQDKRPTFYATSQTMRGQLRIGEVLDLWTTAPDTTLPELFEKTIEVLRGVIVGWENMGDVPFDHDRLSDILSYGEARELLRKIMYNQHMTADEKKSSG